MESSKDTLEVVFESSLRIVDLNAEIRIPVGIKLPLNRLLDIGNIVKTALKTETTIPPGFLIIISTKVTSSCPTYDELQFSHLINGLELN